MTSSSTAVALGNVPLTACHESFEEAAVNVSPFYIYQPGWNGWIWDTGAAGSGGGIALGAAGQPWVPSTNNAAGGSFFAYMQSHATSTLPGTSTLKRTITGLTPGGTAVLSFSYGYRLSSGIPSPSFSLIVTFEGTTIATIANPFIAGWSTLAYTSFATAVSSGVLMFQYTAAANTGDKSVLVDAVTVTAVCGGSTYQNPSTGSCATCSANTITSSSCFESFETTGIAAGGYAYAPAWNSWSFGSSCSGISCAGGSPWDTTPSSTAHGACYAYIQTGGSPTCSLSHGISNLAGGIAQLTFYYTFRWSTGPAVAPSPLVVTYGGMQVFSTTVWNTSWAPVTVTFPVTSATGTLSFTSTLSGGGDHTFLVDAVSVTSYCALGSYPNPSISSCAQCTAGTYLSTVGAASCTTCPAGSYCPTGAATPLTCPPGTFSSSNSATCTACGAGTSSAPGASSCTATCPAGSYLASGTNCSACPGGTFRSSAGGTSVSSCSACAAKTYSPPGATACTALCPAGYYPSTTGTAACIPCASSSFSYHGPSVQMTGMTGASPLGYTTLPSCFESFEASYMGTANTVWGYLPTTLTTSNPVTTANSYGYNGWIWTFGGISNSGNSPWDMITQGQGGG